MQSSIFSIRVCHAALKFYQARTDRALIRVPIDARVFGSNRVADHPVKYRKWQPPTQYTSHCGAGLIGLMRQGIFGSFCHF